jgi:Uncharacterised nucleotidyltransferase
MELTPQQFLAVTATSYFFEGKDAVAFPKFLSKLEADHFVEDAIRQGMAGFLYRYLMDTGDTGFISDSQTTRLRKSYLAAAAQNLIRARHLSDILRLLDRDGVPVVVLKGMALLDTVYDDPGLRPMEDIDLWVPPQHLAELEDILCRMSYQKDSIYPGTFKKKGTILDVRTDLLDADRIRARRNLMGGNHAAIFRRAHRRSTDEANALYLDPSDQVLYLSIHALKHDVSRLIWLADILGVVRLWEEKNWRHLTYRAEATGQKKTLAYILFLLKTLFGFHPPVAASLIPDSHRFSILEHRALRRRLKKNTLPPWSPLVLVSTEKGLKGRLQYVLETLFPRPKILRQVFSHRPDATITVLYLLRLVQLLSMPFVRRR